jgi:energy-coupling factor transport system permease protein
MNAKTKLFSYDLLDTIIHRLSGLTKLICFLFLTFAVMYTYDVRVILLIMAFSIYLLWLSKIKFRQIRTMVL